MTNWDAGVEEHAKIREITLSIKVTAIHRLRYDET